MVELFRWKPHYCYHCQDDITYRYAGKTPELELRSGWHQHDKTLGLARVSGLGQHDKTPGLVGPASPG